jgi:cation:H+ antiporter
LPSIRLLGLLVVLNALITSVEHTGVYAPFLFIVLFMAASLLMIWRLEAMNSSGLDGTVLGTLIMPYCSGIGNLIFAFVIGRSGGSGSEVMTNALVNNVTNMTLLIALPAVFWSMSLKPRSSAKKKRGKNPQHQINRLSLLLTLTAVFVFTGAVWALGRDGKFDFNDGLVLVGLFFFWQTFHVFDVLKSNVRQNKSFGWMLVIDLCLLGGGAYVTYLSIDWLVNWISNIHTGGFIDARNLGWLSGWLMVLPNGLLALYYGWRGNPEIVYTSQVGDGNICIPLCVGVFALNRTCVVPAMFETGVMLLFAATVVHFFCVALFGGLPRVMGWFFIGAYGVFLYQGLLKP